VTHLKIQSPPPISSPTQKAPLHKEQLNEVPHPPPSSLFPPPSSLLSLLPGEGDEKKNKAKEMRIEYDKVMKRRDEEKRKGEKLRRRVEEKR
jgi:hypothetical protein